MDEELKAEQGEEVITLQMRVVDFTEMYNNDLLPASYVIKRVEPHKEEYPDDPVWKQLKKQSNEAYKLLKDYEFNKRHNLKQ